MARVARTVIPGLPHHVTQRGNRRAPVFFSDDDYRVYASLVGRAARACGTEIWAFCLMPNHVHFVLVPSIEDGLRRTFAEAHRQYTGRINARFGWTGHLWQGRFFSNAMDERHLRAALRYVAMNPVRAGLVENAEDWPWASTRTLIAQRRGGFVEIEPVLRRTGDFRQFLGQQEDILATAALRDGASAGRPLGSADWVRSLAAAGGRALEPSARPMAVEAQR